MIILLLSLATINQSDLNLSDWERAVIQAQYDAQNDRTNYEFASVFLPGISLIFAINSTPSIQPHRILRKSDEYIVSYIYTYRNEKRKIEIEHAILCSLWGAGAFWIIYNLITCVK